MKFLRNITFALVLMIFGQVGLAQQQVMFTQYMFNGLAINPAYAGSHDNITATFLAREQWVGLEGAPASQTFSLHSPINASGSANLGTLLIHDRIGVTDQTTAYLAFAYRIRFSGSARLAFGLQGGISNYNSKFSRISNADPVFANGDVNINRPNFGAGLYFNTNRFFAGVSVPQLVRSKLDVNNSDSDSRLERHYFGYAGYVFDISRDLKFKPNLLIKYVENAPIEFDVNANFLIKDIIWAGLSYRSFDSFDALFQVQVNKQFQFGYSYDFATTTDLRRVNSGSHEIMLQYTFVFGKKKIISPRYF
ncbi:type IX secretion system membrane protein PorP/SprF [Roseivirga sp.]|uniref:PorP/SprF family type IX secretion system membrane protein n=1 Tax=Roseivirga sp. TaxID=1964215 RepID=UPI003B8AD759